MLLWEEKKGVGNFFRQILGEFRVGFLTDAKAAQKRFPLQHYLGTLAVVIATGFSLLFLISALAVGGLPRCPARPPSREARPHVCPRFTSVG